MCGEVLYTADLSFIPNQFAAVFFLRFLTPTLAAKSRQFVPRAFIMPLDAG